MPAGQQTTKQTWLLDNVELRGVVRGMDGESPGSVLKPDDDDFNLIVDPNYRHIAMQYNVDRASIGEIHCETYPFEGERYSETNHYAPWPLAAKPGDQSFMVFDPVTGQSRPMKYGDHIRVTGRWTIDKHPEDNLTRQHGCIKIGHVHMELHPLRWDTIELDPMLPRTANHEVVSLAAPLFDEVYLGTHDAWNNIAGVGSRVYISDDLSNFHDTVTAHAEILAPPLDGPSFTPASSLIDWQETILLNGTGLDPSAVRTVTVTNDRIVVDASVTAPPVASWREHQVNSMSVADINDPANGSSVFQATYSVTWKPRLLMLAALSVGTAAVGSSTNFALDIENVGPDPITIQDISNIDWATEGGPDLEFTISTPTPVVVPPMSGIEVLGTFTPASRGAHQPTLYLLTDDPGFGPTYEVQLTGIGT